MSDFTGPVAAPIISVEQAVAAARAFEQPAFIAIRTDQPSAAEAQPPAAGGELGEPGPLAGMPFAAKDNIDVAGFATTAGNPASDQVVQTSATVIQLLVAAGAVPIGKTNLDQYATGLVGTRSPYGACHSVFSNAHVSGGSSSGSAVAVASGVVPFALGTDTAGSGRVPAAFNGLIGLKPTRGLVSSTGVVPACRSLDCVTVLSKTIATVRSVLAVIAQYDAGDPFSRMAPRTKVGLRGARPVIGVPSADLNLDAQHQKAWEQALDHAATIGELIEIDVEPFLQAAQLLYSGPWLAERAVAFGSLLSDAPGIDPTVRKVVAGAAGISAEDAFRGMYRLAELDRETAPAWQLMDVLMLPTTPTHPTLEELAAEPVAANSNLGRFTNMVNLLDLAAIALPAGLRVDGLPFGIQLISPAFGDDMLVELGAQWMGEPTVPSQTGTVELAVAGAHLSGQPLNWQLTERRATLKATTTMASGYRMYEVAGPLPRPGLTRVAGLTEPTSLEVEVWELPATELASFMLGIAPPLAIGKVELADGEQVLGFVCSADGVDPGKDITAFGGWRSYLASKT